MNDSRVIAPGGTIGVLGSGQLGRMFALAARAMGYRIHVLSAKADAPTGQVADREVVAQYDDVTAVRAFGREVDVVTYEFENVPAATTEALRDVVPVRPHGSVLHITQQRLREKSWLRDHGFPVPSFYAVRNESELRAAVQALGGRAILKTAGWGYDGKGQARITPESDVAAIWESLQTDEAICEAWVDFALEASVVAARGLDGSLADYGVFENEHQQHILDLTIAPARIEVTLAAAATTMAREILTALDVVGVMCVELFVTREGGLLINELAPRPHNSGHLTIEGCPTSQFAQQVRAVCGLPLGETALHGPVAMANLLGDLWAAGEPDWAQALMDPAVSLHLYGKSEALPGRKMGHLTAFGSSVAEARARVTAARERASASAQKLLYDRS